MKARRGALAPWQNRKAMDFLAGHLDAKIHLPDLAAHCRLSTSYFSRAFKSSNGVTAHRWRTMRRVERAMLLLVTGESIASVGLLCGFSDQSHFTRVFAHVTGLPPGTWRTRALPPNTVPTSLAAPLQAGVF